MEFKQWLQEVLDMPLPGQRQVLTSPPTPKEFYRQKLIDKLKETGYWIPGSNYTFEVFEKLGFDLSNLLKLGVVQRSRYGGYIVPT